MPTFDFHKIHPVGNRLLVEIIPTEQAAKTISPSGIELPAQKSTKPSNMGRIVKLGDGRTLADGTVAPVKGFAVGDVVMWLDYTEKLLPVQSPTGAALATVWVDDVYVNVGAVL